MSHRLPVIFETSRAQDRNFTRAIRLTDQLIGRGLLIVEQILPAQNRCTWHVPRVKPCPPLCRIIVTFGRGEWEELFLRIVSPLNEVLCPTSQRTPIHAIPAESDALDLDSRLKAHA